MTNEKKLELTLCGMLPYVLKLFSEKEAFYGIPKVKSKIITLCGINDDCIYYQENGGEHRLNKSYIKPLLNSLDKLTVKMFDGKSAMDIIQIYPPENVNYLIEQIISGYVESIVEEQLKKLHFNVYNLPKEMYIEKSEIKIK